MRVLSIFLTATAVSTLLGATQLNQGFNFITATTSVNLDTYKSNINKVYAIDQFNGLSIYNGDSAFNFALTSLSAGKSYLVSAKSSFDMQDVNASVDNAISNLLGKVLYTGYNIVSMPVHDLSLRVNGAIINKAYGVDQFNGLSIYDSQSSFNFALSSTEQGKYYLFNVNSINIDEYLTNGLVADPDLTSYTTTNLNDKSILVMENNSTALKTSLITFSSDQSYKEVEVSNFSASSLNGSDADINATVSSAVSSLTTGACGNWNFDGTDLNMTPSDGTTTGTTVQISDSSDGNFTIGSTYKKVVYYGAAIDLSNVTDCQLDSFLLPPSVPN